MEVRRSNASRKAERSPEGRTRTIVLSREDADNLDFLVEEARPHWARKVTRERLLSSILHNLALDIADGVKFRIGENGK